MSTQPPMLPSRTDGPAPFRGPDRALRLRSRGSPVGGAGWYADTMNSVERKRLGGWSGRCLRRGFLVGFLGALLVSARVGSATADSTPSAAVAAAPPQDSFTGVARVVAIGDIHGDFERLQQVLRLCQLTDAQDRWIGGKTHLVQTGDVLDRGPDSKKAMDLLMALEQQAQKAGGAVHALIGNHELMNMLGDLRYVSNGELAALGAGPRTTPVGSDPAAEFPSYRAAFAPTGKYGKWILSHNAVLKINDTLFMHGGLSPRYLNRKLGDLNDSVRAELLGVRGARPGVGSDPEGPLWYRGLAESLQDQVLKAYLTELGRAQGAQRIVMGHTIQERGITLREGGRLALIDVGMSRWTVSGQPSCLLIEKTPAGDKLSILK